MPLENRVTPFGEIVATPERGLFFGNRGGRIHDPATRKLTGRRWTSRRWICCVTAFRGRRRTVFGPGYTELFFLDEVTALAAGHRPCMECRRANAVAFRQAVSREFDLAAMIMCDELDRRLHEERLDGRSQRRRRLQADGLPDGAMIADNTGAFAIRGKEMLAWSLAGYTLRRPRAKGMVDVLTPPTTIAALRADYQPAWHHSANCRQFESTS